MTKLAIMARDLTSYFMSPSPLVTRNAYETDKAWHIKPGSSMYGALLVEMKNKPDGWTVTMSQRSAAWLWFAISWGRDYQQVPGMVIADHLGAHLAQEARNAI